MAEFQEVQILDEKRAINEGLRQIREAVVTIKAKMADFQALRAKWAAGVAKAEYAKADLDKLDQVLAPWTTVPAKPLTMAETADAFLATPLGK